MKLLRKLDTILLAIIAGVALTLTVLHIFGVTTSVEEHLPLLTLLLLSTLSLHLVVAHMTQEDFQNDSRVALRRLELGAGQTEVRMFQDAGEVEKYLGLRMLEARKEICDLTWKARISEGFSAPVRQKTHSYLDKCIAKTSARIAYREIFVFNDARRIQKLERRLAENHDGYSCRYFATDDRIPRLQFVIVDEEEVVFFASSPQAPLCSVRDAEICRIFKAYYEAAWAAATKIKDGPTIIAEEVRKIRGADVTNSLVGISPNPVRPLAQLSAPNEPNDSSQDRSKP